MTDDAPPAGGLKNPVSEEDYDEIFSGPAVYSNRVYATVSPEGMRLTFMEQRSKDARPQFRSAAFISLAQGMALRDLLVRQLSQVEIVQMDEAGNPIHAKAD